MVKGYRGREMVRVYIPENVLIRRLDECVGKEQPCIEEITLEELRILADEALPPVRQRIFRVLWYKGGG